MASVVDDVPLWCIERSRVYGPGNLVLIGASRIQLGVVPQVIRKYLPDSGVVQLAVDGRNPIATLVDLCEDTEFGGTILCSLNTQTIMNQESWKAQHEYVRAYRNGITLNQRVNRQLATFVQSRCSFRNPQVNLKRILASIVSNRALPRPYYVTTLADRSRIADYSLTDLDQLTPNWVTVKSVPGTRQVDAGSVQRFKQAIGSLRPAVEVLKERGGRLIFLRMPTSETRFQIEEQRWPRDEYWDRISELTGATTVHFDDFVAMKQFHCPDSSHLDGGDAPAFTVALIQTLQQNGMIPTLDTETVASSNTPVFRDR